MAASGIRGELRDLDPQQSILALEGENGIDGRLRDLRLRLDEESDDLRHRIDVTFSQFREVVDALLYGLRHAQGDGQQLALVHDDSSATGPDAATSGSNPSVEAAGGAPDFGSSVGCVAEDGGGR